MMGWQSSVFTLLIVESGAPGTGLFVYNGAPGPGNPPIFWASGAATDPYGNALPGTAGVEGTGTFTVGSAPNTQLQLASNGGAGILKFLLNNAAITDGLLEAINFGGLGQIFLKGPAKTAAGFTDYMTFTMNSSDGVSSAFWQLGYIDAAGGTHGYLTEGAQGATIQAGSVTAVQPGTGTSPSNPAVSESWHALPLAGWVATPGGYHASYRLLPTGDVELSGRITATAATQTIATLPAGYFQATSPQLAAAMAVISGIAANFTAGQSPRIAISNAGLLTIAGYTVAVGNIVALDGVILPISAG